MSNLGDFLFELGNLHDCTITGLEYRPDLRRMVFEIEDIYWNFEGFPEYKGPRQGTITLEDIQHIEGDINSFHPPLWIYDFELISEDSNTSKVSISFSPAGKVDIVFGRAIFPRVEIEGTE